eukprot:TRINITY_DN1241_c0_g1_i5.p1 TRINITY_DN1241_c0_g1~~TRINITY_DN1241_c0_g1_i5.p1  ORF type:complete len:104 (+),score=27.14 TRINITY_DN1241_c0_g1_i5:113-424(+)
MIASQWFSDEIFEILNEGIPLELSYPPEDIDFPLEAARNGASVLMLRVLFKAYPNTLNESTIFSFLEAICRGKGNATVQMFEFITEGVSDEWLKESAGKVSSF